MVKRSLALFFGLFLLAGIMGAPGLARADWDPGDPYEWRQLPDLTTNGVDVKALYPVADDFMCTGSGPITDIHIWGSFSNDVVPNNLTFYLNILADKPAGQGTPNYSTPANILWYQYFLPGQYTSRLVATVPSPGEYFWDPTTGTVGHDTKVYQFNFFINQDAAFWQQAGTIYWLSLSTDSDTFGWKSRDSQDGHFMDDAVWAPDMIFPLSWQEMRYFIGHPLEGQSMDMAFVITTPVPGSVWLMGSGLLGLSGIMFRRRRRK